MVRDWKRVLHQQRARGGGEVPGESGAGRPRPLVRVDVAGPRVRVHRLRGQVLRQLQERLARRPQKLQGLVG